MKAGEECQLCIEALTEGCNKYDQKYCDLKTRYMTDPNMSAEDAVNEMTRISTPQQIQAIADALIERGVAHR